MINETLEGNKLIAEFMGCSTKNIVNGVMLHEYPSTHETRRLFHFDDLHYNYLWDWLMPVWHKVRYIIVDLDKSIEYEQLKSNYIRAMAYNSIHEAFSEMVIIIKWLNQQNPKP